MGEMNIDHTVVIITVADILQSREKNSSPYYSAMLMIKALTNLVRAWDMGKYSQIPYLILQGKVLPTLLDCLVKTLQSQGLDGSWGCRGPREETSYAILTLGSLFSLPLSKALCSTIISAIDRGRSFLQASTSVEPEYLWIEKVSFGSSRLAEVYMVAALYTLFDLPAPGPGIRELCRADSGGKDFDFQNAKFPISGDMECNGLISPPKPRPCHAVAVKDIST